MPELSSEADFFDKVSFLWNIGDFFTGLKDDIVRLYNFLPGWLSGLLTIALGVAVIVLLIRLIAAVRSIFKLL